VLVQRHEREIQQKLEEQEETALNITETYNSLQQEVEVKTKKLKKVNKMFFFVVSTSILVCNLILNKLTFSELYLGSYSSYLKCF